MMRTSIAGLLCIAALAACGGEAPAAPGTTGPDVAQAPADEALFCEPKPGAIITGFDPSQMDCQSLTSAFPAGTQFSAAALCWYFDAWGKLHYYQCATR